MVAKKPKFINPTSAARMARSRASIPWDIVRLGVAFLVAVLLPAALYYIGTREGWGIQPTFQTTLEATQADSPTVQLVTFADAVYFSVVTIATLGYGDFRPVSYSRAIASAQVVAGIIMMGILVSRLVSRQQERLTKRLIGGQLNREIQDFRGILITLLNEYSTLRATRPDRVALDNQLPDLLHRTSGLFKSIARYWRHEAKLPDLADIVPVRATGRLVGEMISILEIVSEFTPEYTPASFGEDNRNRLRNITESSLTVVEIVESRLDDSGLKHSALKVYALVVALRKQMKLKKFRIKE